MLNSENGVKICTGLESPLSAEQKVLRASFAVKFARPWITTILSRIVENGAMIDGNALIDLIERNILDKKEIVNTNEEIDTKDIACEIFSNHPANSSFIGEKRQVNNINGFKNLEIMNKEKFFVLSELMSVQGNIISPSLILYNSQSPCLLFPYSISEITLLTIERARQIGYFLSNLPEYQGVWIKEMNCFPILYRGDNSTILGIYRLSLDSIDEFTIWLSSRLGVPQTSGYTMPSPKTHRAFASRRLIIADLREEPLNWMDPDYDDSAGEEASVTALHPDKERDCLRPTPLPSLTVTQIQPNALIDAGIATGDLPVVFAEDVAKRITGQKHKSLIRKPSAVPKIFSRKGETVWGLPDPELISPTWPVTIPEVAGDFFLTYDMGIQTSGCVLIDFEAKNETVIDIAYGDHLENGRVDPCEMGHSLADRIILAPGRHRTRLPHDRGFRYLQASFSGAGILHELNVEEHVYPHDKKRRFRCSDPTLNAIWDAACRTAHQCSLFSHVDNSRRERQGWGGPDLYASSRGFFHIFGDTRLTGKHLEDFCDFF